MEKLFKRPWVIVALIGAITVFFALQLPRASVDNNNFNFVPRKDPARLASSRVDGTFGSQILILVGLERRYGTVLDADFLAKLRDYGEKVQALDIVDSVMSMIDMDYIDGQGDAVVVEPLVPEGFTGNPAELEALRERLASWDLYRRSLVSDDLRATQVVIALSVSAEEAGNPETLAAYKEFRRLAYAEDFQGTAIYVAGLPVVSDAVNGATRRDLFFLVPLVILVVVGVLFFSFRRLGGVLLPLLTVLVATIWAMGAMPLLGVKLSIISTVLPVILVAVGSAYGIHVVSHYYDEMAVRPGIDRAQHRALVLAILRKVGWPVFLAALTTLAGFVSFCVTTVVPIFQFGIFSSFGVFAAFAVSMTLIPALILIRGPQRPTRSRIMKGWARREDGEDGLGTAIADLFMAATRKRRSIIFVCLLVAVVSVGGLSRLVIDNVLVEYFKPDTDVALSDRFIREEFGGSKSVSVVVSHPEPGEVLRPDVLGAMDGLGAYLAEKVPEVGKTTSFTDLVKRINQVLNADAPPGGLLPAARTAAADGAGAAAEEEAAPAFGFGFGGFVVEGEAETGHGAAPVPGPVQPRAEALDAKALAALLDKALASGSLGGDSAEDLVEGFRRAVNYKGAAYYEVPTDPARYGKTSPGELKALVSNYLVLLSGDIGSFADDPLEPTAIRMNVQLRTVGQRDTDRAIAAIRDYAAANFPKDVKVEVAGTALIEKSLNLLVVQSQLWSVALSLLMVFLILAFYYRSALAGLIGLAPLAVSVLINFAVMGFAGIKLNIGTAMVASITVGVGIDYTIHYMAAFHREYLLTGGEGDFMRRTFLTSGKAILFNAASVGLGFAVLAFSQFNILASLGLLIALTMATSSLVSLTLLPVLIDMIRPAFITRPLPYDRAETGKGGLA